MTTVVIPAHNEAAVIGRLLRGLLSDAAPGEFDVVVVANGCTDDTADVAASFGPSIRVLRTPEPSKRKALAAGDAAAHGFPRIYVDADVELTGSDLRALAAAIDDRAVLAAGPEREFALAGRGWPVRWYYDVWTRLPEVRRGLFGRGVIAVGARGHERMASLPPVLGDDLAASLAFAPEERRVVSGATVRIHPPRTFADLVKRRIRAATVVAEIAGAYGESAEAARTHVSDLIAITRGEPVLLPKVAYFATLAVIARRRARRAIRSRDFATWLRDDSSRLEQT